MELDFTPVGSRLIKGIKKNPTEVKVWLLKYSAAKLPVSQFSLKGISDEHPLAKLKSTEAPGLALLRFVQAFLPAPQNRCDIPI